MKPKVKKVYAPNRKSIKEAYEENDETRTISSSWKQEVDQCNVRLNCTSAATENGHLTACSNQPASSKIDDGARKFSSAIGSSSKNILLVGDLVWSKISGHSWWPSMISYDPSTAIYFQTSPQNAAVVLKFHVQFFGDQPLRGWVSKANIIRFEGRDHFVNLPARLFPKGKYPSPPVRPSWERGVTQAEKASLLERRSRKLTCVFNYDDNSKGKKQKQPTSKTKESSVKKVIGKKTDVNSVRRRSLRTNTNIKDEKINHEELSQEVSKVVSLEQEKQIQTSGNKNISSENLVTDEKVINPHEVLQEIPIVEGSRENSPIFADSENNSDSGIEDIGDHLIDSTAYEIMEPLGSKRKRKQKIYEDYHTGEDLAQAFKNKYKVAVVEKRKIGKSAQNIQSKGIVFITDTNCEQQTEIKKTELIQEINIPEKNIEISEHEKENVVSLSQKKHGSPNRRSSNRTANTKRINDGECMVGKQEDITETKKNPNIIPKQQASKRNSQSAAQLNDKLKLKITTNTIDKSNLIDKAVKEGTVKKGAQHKTRNIKRKNDSTVVKSLKKQKLDNSVAKLDGQDKTPVLKSQKITDVLATPKEIKIDTSDGDEDVSDSTVKLKFDLRDQYCALCETISGEFVMCSGACFNSYHYDCLGLNCKPNTYFTCDECLTGYHTCFVCKQAGDLAKCSHINCGKFYHPTCIDKFEGKSRTRFYCPLHLCKYCPTNKMGNQSVTNDRKLIKCIRCPTAYHPNSCLVAGCSIISPHNMICDKHFTPDDAKCNVNVTWCFVCSIGGSLVCCDTCPASFHPECTDDLDGIPEGAWQCQNCKEHKKPRYGDIVWVKYGVYRWWPAKICLPSEVPERIQNLPHDLGEFPVLFFGSKDYCWLYSERVFKYEEGDKGGSVGSKTTYLANYFGKALAEAKEAYIELQKERALQEENLNKRKSTKPPPYRRIKNNKPVSCIRTVLEQSEWPVCECQPEDPCSSESECLNRMLLFECNNKTCLSGEQCQNQRMQKCEYVKCQPFKCERRGWGLRAEQVIKCGDFVIEYVGELVDGETCHKRIKQYHDKDIYDYYFLTIDKDNIIDAFPKGNLSRFMNHSCDPNCETQKWTVNGEVRVGLFANRDIAVGDELCFNYNLDCLGNEKKQCKCGSVNCSGYLGVQPKTQHSMSVAEKAKSKKEKEKEKRKLKREKNKLQKVVHEDDCFICGDGGKLILCSRGKCTKSYHVSCLNLEQTPRGKWECPWHYCDECGKLAKAMCALCPNSFCDVHREGEVFVLRDEIVVCVDHDEADFREFLLSLEQKEKSQSSSEEETTHQSCEELDNTKERVNEVDVEKNKSPKKRVGNKSKGGNKGKINLKKRKLAVSKGSQKKHVKKEIDMSRSRKDIEAISKKKKSTK